MLQALLTLLGRGPVQRAITAGLSEKIKKAEDEFIAAQRLLLEEFKLKEEALLKNIALDVIGDLLNGNK